MPQVSLKSSGEVFECRSLEINVLGASNLSSANGPFETRVGTNNDLIVELNIYYPVLLFQSEWLVVIKILKNKIKANVSLIIFLYWSVD